MITRTKKYFIVFFLFLAALGTNAYAQQPTIIEGVSGRSFSGVKASADGQFFYTFYFGEKSEEKGMANFVLQLFDQDLKPIATKDIEISKRSHLSAAAFSGKYFLFIFSDASKKTMTMITLDKTGTIVKQKVNEDVNRNLLTEDNDPEIHIANDDEFILVRADKDEKYGYTIERMDKDLNSKWSKSFFPEKGRWDLVDSRYKNGKIYILRSDKPTTAVGEKYYYKVQGIDANTGNEQYLTALENDGDGGFPSFIRVENDGTVATGGMYFGGSKYDDKNSDGFFFALIGADGKTTTFSKTSWKQVKDQIRGEFSTNLVGGKTKPLIEDLVRKSDGTYMLIGETFRKSNAEQTGSGMLRKGGMGLGKGLLSGGTTKDASGNDESGFTLMDFIMINFDAKGTLTGIDKVDKPSREAVIKGDMASAHGLELAEWLCDTKKFFCYRYTIDVNGKQYIVFKNEDGYKVKAYFMPVGATSAEGLGFIDLDKWMPEGVNKMGQVSKWTDGNKHTFESTTPMGQPESYELFKNVVPAKPGYVMLYQLSYKGTLNIWLEPVPVK